MYKILIVDDEPFVRMGLRNVVQWSRYGCEVCGEAQDGTDGIEMVREHMPDIVFTDIRMHDMNGLEMTQAIKSIVPNCIVIIISGYREFEYAQEALRLQAFAFILKPTVMSEIHDVLERAVNKLKADRCASDIQKAFGDNLPFIREKLLSDIMQGNKNSEHDISLYDIELGEFTIVLAQGDEALRAEVSKVIAAAFADELLHSVRLDNMSIALIVRPHDGLYDNCLTAQEKVLGLSGVLTAFAVGGSGKSAADLKGAYDRCIEALSYKEHVGNGCIVEYQSIDSFFRAVADRLKECRQKLLKAVQCQNRSDAESALDQLCELTLSVGEKRRVILYNFYWNCIFSMYEISGAPSVFPHLRALIERCDSVSALNDILCRIAFSAIEKDNSINVSSKIQKALQYIHAHYSEQITLNDVADSIFVSSHHASRVFKKEVGKSFVDYLNEVRIEKAKELLLDVRYKTYEVGEMVGILDGHYFSKLFKRYTGMSPTEYRGG